MAKINASFAHDVYRFLIKPLRDADDSGVLEGYLGGVQTAFEQTQADQSALLDLFDIDNCPEWALDYLLWIVGWTKPLQHITDGLTVAQKRKVIRLSAQLWKQKGTPTGIKNSVRLFTGRDVVYWSWFYMRIETDQSGFWYKGIGGIDPWLVGQAYGDRDEYLSICWIMDEDGVDKELIHDLIQLNRPMGEAIQVCYADLVDDFQLGIAKWQLGPLGTAPTWDNVNYKMGVANNTIIESNVIGLDQLDQFTLVASLTLSSLSNVGVFFMWDGAFPSTDGMLISFSATGWDLTQSISGTATSIASGTLPVAIPIADPVGIAIHVIDETAMEKRFKVLVDGVEVVDYLMTPTETAGLVPGSIGFLTTTSTHMTVDNVIMFGHPLYCDTVEVGQEIRDPEPGASPPIWTDVTPVSWNAWANWAMVGLWHSSSYKYRSVAGPGANYMGANEVGYHAWGAAGDHDGPNNSSYTTSPGASLDLSGFNPTDHRIWLEFWQQALMSYIGVEDNARVQLRDGSSTVHEYTKAEIVGLAPVTQWQRVRLDITTHLAGVADARIRFISTPNAVHVGSDEGWYIDDVRILVEKL